MSTGRTTLVEVPATIGGIIQELRRRQDRVVVAMDAAAWPDLAQLCDTLPGVAVVPLAQAETATVDLAVIPWGAVVISPRHAERVYVCGASRWERPLIERELAEYGLASIHRLIPIFGRNAAEIEAATTPGQNAYRTLETGDYLAAMRQAELALTQTPDDVDALVTVAELALHGGRRELARRFWTTARRLAVDDPRLAELKQGLDGSCKWSPLAKRLAGTAKRLARKADWVRASIAARAALAAGSDISDVRPYLLSTELQTRVSEALEKRDSASALSLVQAVLNDDQCSGEMALSILDFGFSTAAVRAVQPMIELLGLPKRTVLVTFQPWFGIDYLSLMRRALAADLFLPVFSGVRAHYPAAIAGLSEENFRQYAHKGIQLWLICQYNLALMLRTMPEAITAEHLDTIRQVYARAAALLDEANQFIEAYHPETVMIAQGYDLMAAVMRSVCVPAGIRLVSIENIFHRGKLLWEDVGGIAVNKTLAKNYYWRYCDFVSDEEARRTTAAYVRSIDEVKSSEHASARSSLSLEREGRQVILYLGQVSTDSSVLFGRRGFDSQLDTIRAVAEYAAARAPILVVKLHPKESSSYKGKEPYFRGLTSEWLERDATFERCRKQLGGRLIVDADNAYNTYELIQQADVCVTINSQAGLEALLYDKEVILCGDASFGGLGFTHEAEDRLSLTFQLDRVLEQQYRRNDGIQCRKFFHIFNELYCLPKTEATLLSLLRGRPAFAPLGMLNVATAKSADQLQLS